MSMPSAGVRPLRTSQKLSFEVTPTPSGVGQLISGAIVIGGPGGGAADVGRRTGGFPVGVCAGSVVAAARTAMVRSATRERIRSAWYESVVADAREARRRRIARRQDGISQLDQLQKFHARPGVVAEGSLHGAGHGE